MVDCKIISDKEKNTIGCDACCKVFAEFTLTIGKLSAYHLCEGCLLDFMKIANKAAKIIAEDLVKETKAKKADATADRPAAKKGGKKNEDNK